MTQQPISFALGGGLDLVTPPLAKSPGRVIAALNYEPVAVGYRRLRGYERFDGRTAPSSSSVPATIATLRAAITAVPGSGPVRGIHHIDGNVVAARDNSGATAGKLYQSTTSGWVEMQFARSLEFSSGDADLESTIGIVGATSGATAFLGRIDVVSGSISGGTASGVLYLNGVTGAFINGETLQNDLGQPAAVAVGTLSSSFTLPAGGAYKFLTHNFYGASNLKRVYGVNGVGKGFVIDPINSFAAPISTGMVVDSPTRLAEHRGSLFYAFPGGSIQFSTVGDPEDWSPVTGAGEIGIGTEVTDLASLLNALAILGETSIHVLYGSDSSDYQLEGLNEEAGALAHTAQNFGSLIYMDNRGLRSLAAAQKFGNFTTGTLSRLIAPLLEAKRRASIEPSASLICRTADQYWLFFEDGTGIIAYLGGKEPAVLPFSFGQEDFVFGSWTPLIVTCATSVEDDGVERLFIGASNGFVYELNKGTSFDGEPVEHYVALAYNNMGSAQGEKRIFKAVIDVEASGTTTISASARFNLGSVDGPDAQVITLTTGGGAINDHGTGEDYYASLTPAVGEVYFDGVFRDISLKISGSQSTQEPHTLTGVTYLVSPRGLRR